MRKLNVLFLLLLFPFVISCSGNPDYELNPDVPGNIVDNESNDENDDSEDANNNDADMDSNILKIIVGNQTLTATLVDNSSTRTLKEILAERDVTIQMEDYANMEKVGPFGFNLPRNDERITTTAGDLILYQGSSFVIYYAPNTWNFTRLGKIDNATQASLLSVLGSGDVTVTLSMR